MILRPYQEAAIAAVHHALATTDSNPGVVLPTGAGKTVIFAHLLKALDAERTEFRAVVLAHRGELLQQAAEKIVACWPGADIGAWSATLGQADTHRRIVVAGIQTAANAPETLGVRDLVIVDEAHRIPTYGDGQYRTVLAALRRANPKLKVFWTSASPYRLDSGKLGLPGQITDSIVYELPVGTLAEGGHILLPNYHAPVSHRPDLSDVPIVAGEYNGKALEEKLRPGVVSAIEDALSRLNGRKSRLWFCSSKVHANTVASLLAGAGGSVAVVTGGTKKKERTQHVEDFKAGRLRDLVNVGVFTEGFDAPNVDAVVLLAATASPVKYLQMAGRGFRPATGKQDWLLLDYGGNVFRHGFVHDIYYPKTGSAKEEQQDRVQGCPNCLTLMPFGVPMCAECGFLWPPKVERASVGGGVSDTPAQVIDRVDVEDYTSRNGNRMVRITYTSGKDWYHDYLVFERDNPYCPDTESDQHKAYEGKTAFARKMAAKKLMAWGIPPPWDFYDTETAVSVLSTLAQENPPKRVLVKKRERNWEVVGLEF